MALVYDLARRTTLPDPTQSIRGIEPQLRIVEHMEKKQQLCPWIDIRGESKVGFWECLELMSRMKNWLRLREALPTSLKAR